MARILSFSVFKDDLPIVGDGTKLQTIRVIPKNPKRQWVVGQDFIAYWRLRYPKAKGGSQPMFGAILIGKAELGFRFDPGFGDISYKLWDIEEHELVKGLLDWTPNGIAHEDGFQSPMALHQWFSTMYEDKLWYLRFNILKFDYVWDERPQLHRRPGYPGFEESMKIHKFRPRLPDWGGTKCLEKPE